jgi:hypothetical protein
MEVLASLTLKSTPTYLRCGVTLNVDDYGKKER